MEQNGSLCESFLLRMGFLAFSFGRPKEKITKRKTAGFCFETATFLCFFASKLKPDFY